MANDMKGKRMETIKTKCLYSEIYTQPKEFKSIFPCKHKPMTPNPFTLSARNRETFYSMGINGPLIVTHNTMGEKITAKPRKHYYEEFSKVKPYRYFQQHQHCEETKHYYFDLQHQKIFRHYSKDKKKKKKINKKTIKAK